jgi:predicted site-specific integrase-resolvase
MIFDGVELPSLLPLKKACAVLSVDAATLQQWIESGELQTVHVNGQIRILTSSIEDRMGQRTLSRTNHGSQT